MNHDNPYAASTDSVTELTAIQQRMLNGLLAYRRHPSAWRMLISAWPQLLFNLIFAAAVIAVPAWFELPRGIILLAVAFALGMFSASTGGIIGLCIARKRVWPALERIIDWDCVHQLSPAADQTQPDA